MSCKYCSNCGNKLAGNGVFSDHVLKVFYKITTPENKKEITKIRATDELDDRTPIEDAISAIKHFMKEISSKVLFPSKSEFTKGLWYETTSIPTKSGAKKSYSFHLKGFTLNEEQQVYDKLKSYLKNKTDRVRSI